MNGEGEVTAEPVSQPSQSQHQRITDEQKLLSNLNERLKTIYSALPARAALLIFTGHGDPRAMAELNRRRVKFEAGFRAQNTQGQRFGGPGFGAVGNFLSGGVLLGPGPQAAGMGQESGKVKDTEIGEEVKWTSENARKLEEETERAKKGLMFLCMKK